MKNIVLGLTLLVFCFFNSTTKVNGQSKTKLNTVYFELGGNGLFTSINYERQLLKNTGLNFHVGTGIYGVQSTYLTIPFGIKYLFKVKNSNSYFDLGFGATYSKADVRLYASIKRNSGYIQTNFWNYIPNVGYRRLTKKNLMYRIAITPILNHNDFLPFFGFSIGKCF
jgi:hypothetical protein